jgi:hypothetical protein
VKYLCEFAGEGAKWERPSLIWKELTWLRRVLKPSAIGITGLRVAIVSSYPYPHKPPLSLLNGQIPMLSETVA